MVSFKWPWVSRKRLEDAERRADLWIDRCNTNRLALNAALGVLAEARRQLKEAKDQASNIRP